MTFREKLCTLSTDGLYSNGDCIGCPSDYGFDTTESELKNCACNGGRGCAYCWNREMPDSEPDEPVKFRVISSIHDDIVVPKRYPQLESLGYDGKFITITSLGQLLALQKAVGEPIILDVTGSINYKPEGPALEIYDGYRE